MWILRAPFTGRKQGKGNIGQQRIKVCQQRIDGSHLGTSLLNTLVDCWRRAQNSPRAIDHIWIRKLAWFVENFRFFSRSVCMCALEVGVGGGGLDIMHDRPKTLACSNEAGRIFTDQADIACTKREAP